MNIRKSYKLSLPKEIGKDAIYYGEYGNNHILFIGHKTIYEINNKGKIDPVFNFAKKVMNKDYILGFSTNNRHDIRALITTKDSFVLMNMPGEGKENELLNEYVTKFDKTSIGEAQSNCIYQESDSSFLFLIGGGQLVKIYSN